MTVDYFSDFFEFGYLRSTSSVYVIKELKGHFARHGIPEHSLLITGHGLRWSLAQSLFRVLVNDLWAQCYLVQLH